MHRKTPYTWLSVYPVISSSPIIPMDYDIDIDEAISRLQQAIWEIDNLPPKRMQLNSLDCRMGDRSPMTEYFTDHHQVGDVVFSDN